MCKLLQFIIILYLLTNSSAHLLPLTVDTLQNLNFAPWVTSITTGPTVNLIIAAVFSVWDVNIKVDPPTKHLIAGTSEGYKEGIGADAQFRLISGVIVMNLTHILISDLSNYCLRTIDLRTNTTSQYAGTCKHSGSNDGPRLDAKFSHLSGMLKLRGKIYITEFSPGSIRVLESDSVTTLYTGSSLRYHDQVTGCTDRFLYVTFAHGVALIDLSNHPVIPQLLTGSTDTVGYVDGNLTSSRYDDPRGIALLNKDTLVVADGRNNRLRILDLQNNKVTSICSGQNSSNDGNITHCSLNLPISVHVYEDQLLVGEGRGLIRRIPLYFIIDVLDEAAPIQRVTEDEEVGQIKVFINKPTFHTDQAVIRMYGFIAEEVLDSFRESDEGFIDKEILTNYGDAQKNNLTYYITGEITPTHNNRRIEFSYGDGMYYEGYHNVELRKDSEYRLHYLFQYEWNGEIITKIVESTEIFIPKQKDTTDIKLEYLSLLSLLFIMVAIPVIIIFCKKRQTMETRAEEGDGRVMNMIDMNNQVNRNTEYDQAEAGSVHAYESIDEQEKSPLKRQSRESMDGYDCPYANRHPRSQPDVQETRFTNDGYEIPDSHKPVLPHV